MTHSTPGPRARQIQALRNQFAQDAVTPLADLLPPERLETLFAEEHVGWRERLWRPTLTLWAFLAQVVCPDGSCRRAVARAIAWLVHSGQPAASAQTGPYCKARARLPLGLFTRLTRDTGRDLHQAVPAAWLWKGRRVQLVDGTTVSMPDTPATQAAYPQQSGQKPGLGFPIARVVVVFCLACGAVLDAALGRIQGKRTGENTLFRRLGEALTAGDVVVGDRYYGSYWDIAGLQLRGIDGVFRLHPRRRADFRTGVRLGHDDHLAVWRRPERPDWMDEATYEQMPRLLIVRELRVRVAEPGFRTRCLVVVTTLGDAQTYSHDDLAGLYRARWHAELDLRSLKGPLGLDVLRCKSPAMVAKEFWARLLAYNLIRSVMARAAQAAGVVPLELSFKGALQSVGAFAERLTQATGAEQAELEAALLRMIASHRVGDRPGRCEPRARKRRPKQYPLLTKPRPRYKPSRSQRVPA